ncbi:hypothetical protein OUZ56_003190 [Daphnia magna]|uniref:Uncharacterized protein n=1 Tax=Daphnia magna TaxID=35525 RepID=A0ABR0A822_9CRUS|nr:hypothetical protein OUZ56_003190 [Daphnia magna]
MGLFDTGYDCSTTGANRALSIPAASSSMTLVTFTGIICRKLACRTHSSEVAEHNRGIFMTPTAGSTCGRPIPLILFPGHWSTMVTVPLDSFLLLQKDSSRAALHPSFSVNRLREWAHTAHVWSAFPDFVHVELDEQLPIWRYPQVWSQSRVRVGYRLLFAGGYRRRKHTVNLQGIIKLKYRQMNEQTNVAVHQRRLHPGLLVRSPAISYLQCWCQSPALRQGLSNRIQCFSQYIWRTKEW